MSAPPEPRPAAAEGPGEPAPGRLPDFLIVGHMKCGTTALNTMLSGHPGIFMCPVKEPRFFAPDQRSRFRSGKSTKHPETLAGYRALFAAAAPGQLVGEASPQYLRSAEAAERIAAVRPDAKIIAIFREPASFLRSFHLQAVHNDQETETDLRRALALEGARREGRQIPARCGSPAALMYADHVRYTDQLKRFHAAFGPEQVLALIYDDLRADNAATVRQVLRFIGADELVDLAPTETDTLKSVRFPALHRFATAMRVAERNPRFSDPLARAFNGLIPDVARSPAVRRRWRKLVYGAPPPADEQLMRELRLRFRGEVESFSEYIGRDLSSLWGYEQPS